MIDELINIPTQVLQLVNADQAYHYRVIPYKEEGGKIYFKTDQYLLDEFITELQIVLGREIILEQESKHEIEISLQKITEGESERYPILHWRIQKIFYSISFMKQKKLGVVIFILHLRKNIECD